MTKDGVFIGLPKADNAQMRNIHLLTCSNRVGVLEMIEPIIPDLRMLETTGFLMFDAHLQQEVLVIAPVLLGMHDNPRASEVVNHMGSSANLFCRICMVSRKIYFHAIYLIIASNSVTRESVLTNWVNYAVRHKFCHRFP